MNYRKYISVIWVALAWAFACPPAATWADADGDPGWWQRRQQRRARQAEIRGWSDQDWEAFGQSLAADPEFQQLSERERAIFVADRVGSTLDEGGIVPNVSIGGRIRSGVEHATLDAGTCSDVTKKLGAALTGAGIDNGSVVVNQSGARTWNPFNVNRDHGAPFVVIDGKRYVMDLWLHGGDRRGWVSSGSFSDFEGSGFEWIEIDDWKSIMEDAGYDLSTTEEYYVDPRAEEARLQAQQNLEEAARRLGIDPEGKSSGELGSLIMERASELGIDPDGIRSVRELAEEIVAEPAPEPAAEPEPPDPEPTPEEEAEPEPAPETEPEADPSEEPDMEPESDMEPEPDMESEPESDFEPELTEDPLSEPPEREYDPDPARRPRPEGAEDPELELEPEPEPEWEAEPDFQPEYEEQPDWEDPVEPDSPDMSDLWSRDRAEPDYEVGRRYIDDDGIEYERTRDGDWETTGDRYEPITREQRDEWDRSLEEARRRLQQEEPTSPDWTGDRSNFDRDGPGGLLDQFADRRQVDRQQQVNTASDSMELSRQMGQAARSGDQQIRDARQTRSMAGRDAQTTREQATRDAARAQREQSWGNVLGDAVSDGVQQGLEEMASNFGRAAADEVAGQIFGPTREERQAARDAATASDPGQPAPDGGAPGPAASVGAAPSQARPAPGDSDPGRSTASTEEEEEEDPIGIRDTRENPDGTVTIRYGCGYSWTGVPPGPSRCSICARETVSTEVNTPPPPVAPSPTATTPPAPPQPDEPSQAEINAAYQAGASWRRNIAIAPSPEAAEAVRGSARADGARYQHPALRAAFQRGLGQ